MQIKLNLFLTVYVMKLDDIKKAVVHAAEAEFKRAFYNLASVMDVDDVSKLYHSLFDEVYAVE